MYIRCTGLAAGNSACISRWHCNLHDNAVKCIAHTHIHPDACVRVIELADFATFACIVFKVYYVASVGFI